MTNKIVWLDPVRVQDEEIKRPFKANLAETVSYGEIEEDDYCVVVINSKNNVNEEKDFITIPKSLIIKKELYVVQKKT